MADAGHDAYRAPVTSVKRTTLVLAEDHQPMAEELRTLLSETFDVLAVVAHGEGLIEAVRQLQPDIVVTDISMPGMDGLRATKQLLAERPQLPVVFITVHDDAMLARAALALGKGYVLKAAAGDELIDALKTVLGGGRFLSSALGRFDALMAGHDAGGSAA